MSELSYEAKRSAESLQDLAMGMPAMSSPDVHPVAVVLALVGAELVKALDRLEQAVCEDIQDLRTRK